MSPSSQPTLNRRTALLPGEIVTAVLVPKPSPSARSAFVKLGARRYLVISIASVAGCLAYEGQRGVTHAIERRGEPSLAWLGVISGLIKISVGNADGKIAPRIVADNAA